MNRGISILRTFSPLLVYFVLCASVFAQDPLTLDACLAEAAANNPDLVSAREAMQKADYQYRASLSDSLPQISADGNLGRSGRETTDDQMEEKNSSSVGLSARQDIFTGGRNRATRESALAEKQSAEARLMQAEAKLTFDVRSAFAQLLYAQEQIALTEEIAKRRADNVDLIELRYEGGREHKGSMLYTKAVYRQAQADISNARRSLRVAQRGLARVLGRREMDSVKVGGAWDYGKPPESPDLQSLMTGTPEHLLALAQIDSALASVRSAKSRFYPSVGADASASRGSEDWPPDQDSWSIGLSISYPLYTGGKDRLNVLIAKVVLRQAEAEAQSQDDQVILALEEARARFEDTVEQVEVSAEFLRATEVRAEISRAQYTSGLLSFDNWDPIENDLISQQKNQLSARREAMIAEAGWDKVLGRSLLPK